MFGKLTNPSFPRTLTAFAGGAAELIAFSAVPVAGIILLILPLIGDGSISIILGS